jgi:hypothetical protein
MLTFAHPTSYDLSYIAENMREADVAEIRASHGHTPLQALCEGEALSDYVIAVRADGVPMMIYGLVVRDILTGAGTPWMLATDEVFHRLREMAKLPPIAIGGMLSVCPRLSNHVHARNKLSIRWLKRVGFTIEPPQPVGIKGEMFHRFYMNKES